MAPRYRKYRKRKNLRSESGLFLSAVDNSEQIEAYDEPSEDAESTCSANPIGWPEMEVLPELNVVYKSPESKPQSVDTPGNSQRPVRDSDSLSSGSPGIWPICRRIITVAAWEESIRKSTLHVQTCLDGSIQMVDETRNGLRSYFKFKCAKCDWHMTINSDEDHGRTLPVNEALAWGTYAGGSHYEASRHLLTLLELPVPSYPLFQSKEDRLLQQWTDALQKDIIGNGREERRLALEKGHTIKIGEMECAYTTVTVDGGWSTRSYGHSYKSKGGVGVIIGQLTGKILFIGIRNKFCMFCKRHETANSIQPHTCYKNYDANRSATSMEPDILLEGFRSSIEDHGLVYKTLIGDGDSSVFNTLVENVRYGDLRISKIECVNHAVKRFNKHLILAAENTRAYSLYSRKVVKQELNRFGLALKSAIAYNHVNNPSDHSLLRKDIINIPHHIFGDHQNCRSYFCTSDHKAEPNRINLVQNTPIWNSLKEVILRAANISDKLIHNLTSNQAESFMNRAAKFNMGKRIFVMGRSGWSIRMTAAALSFNRGPNFYVDVFKLHTAISPSIQWKKEKACQSKRALHCKRNKKKRQRNFGLTDSSKTPSTQRSHIPRRLSFSQDKDYGSNPNGPDMDEQELKLKIEGLISGKQMRNEAHMKSIESATIDQTISPRWHKERSGRITASVAGSLFGLKDCTSNKSTLRRMLKPPNLDHLPAVQHGKIFEGQARRAYEEVTGEVVRPCGLFVSLENGIFAATPDGLVGNDGIIEIKCPFSLEGFPPTSMPSIMKGSYLVPDPNDKQRLMLRRSHHYYKQVVMQLHITGRKWSDFVVYTFKFKDDTQEETIGFEPFIERIYRDDDTALLWSQMKEKMGRFYREDYAPEKMNSRAERSMDYRIPEYRRLALEKHALEITRKALVLTSYSETIESVIQEPQSI